MYASEKLMQEIKKLTTALQVTEKTYLKQARLSDSYDRKQIMQSLPINDISVHIVF